MKIIHYPQYSTYNDGKHFITVPLGLQKFIPTALTFCTGKVTKISAYKFKFHVASDVTRFIKALKA